MNKASLRRIELSEIDRNLSKFLFLNAVEIPHSVPGGWGVKHFYQNWKEPWFLQSIEEIEHPLLSNPYKRKIPVPSKFKTEEQIDSDIENLVLKAIRFTAKCFWCEGRRVKTCRNLKNPNSFLRYEHFKMKGLHKVQLLRDLMKEGNLIVRLDSKDAYLTINVAEEFRKFLIFFKQNNRVYFPFIWNCNSTACVYKNIENFNCNLTSSG